MFMDKEQSIRQNITSSIIACFWGVLVDSSAEGFQGVLDYDISVWHAYKAEENFKVYLFLKTDFLCRAVTGYNYTHFYSE